MCENEHCPDKLRGETSEVGLMLEKNQLMMETNEVFVRDQRDRVKD